MAGHELEVTCQCSVGGSPAPPTCGRAGRIKSCSRGGASSPKGRPVAARAGRCGPRGLLGPARLGALRPGLLVGGGGRRLGPRGRRRRSAPAPASAWTPTAPGDGIPAEPDAGRRPRKTDRDVPVEAGSVVQCRSAPASMSIWVLSESRSSSRETLGPVAGRPAQGVRRLRDLLRALPQRGQALGEAGPVRLALQSLQLAVQLVAVGAEPLEECQGLLQRLVLGHARVQRVLGGPHRGAQESRSWASSPWRSRLGEGLRPAAWSPPPCGGPGRRCGPLRAWRRRPPSPWRTPPSATNSTKISATIATTASMTILSGALQCRRCRPLFHGKRNRQAEGSSGTPNLPVGDYPEPHRLHGRSGRLRGNDVHQLRRPHDHLADPRPVQRGDHLLVGSAPPSPAPRPRSTGRPPGAP